METNKRLILLILAAVIVVLGAAFVLWLRAPNSCFRKVELITIGTGANAGDTLIFIADEQKYFTDNGLNVTLKTYVNGLAATDGMLGGEADLAYSTEFITVGKALQKTAISIVTTYSKAEAVAVVGLKERGIENISDLKGKKIGFEPGTIMEFYLGRLLMLNGLNLRDVTLVDIQPMDAGDSLSSGKIDAAIASSRYLHLVIQQLGSKLFVWPAHSHQPAYGTLVGKPDWVTHHPELVKRLLKSLSEAEQYVSRNPEKAKAVLQKKLNFDDKYMAEVWSGYQFSLSLDQSLIVAMEDEARWMIKNKLTTERRIPDFSDYIYLDGLKAVKPEAVNIIR